MDEGKSLRTFRETTTNRRIPSEASKLYEEVLTPYSITFSESDRKPSQMKFAVTSDWVYLLSIKVSTLMFAGLFFPVTSETCSKEVR